MFHKMEGDRRKKRVTLDLNPHILFWTKLLMLMRYTKIITLFHEKNWPSIQVCFLGAPPALPFISA